MAHQLVILKVMKILLISIDPILIDIVKTCAENTKMELLFFNDSTDPLDILSGVYSMHPAALIIDDDYLNPNTSAILKSIKKVNQKVAIIFVTSNDSIELGREISNLGIQFYTLKPIAENELKDLFESIPKLVNKHLGQTQ
ncbi:MAG: hypothetical protein A2V66_13950 [Ignavibacteria bacterium RBG_13_36_8]|nr:MAG: hypothetical protein A2V66_13950 [Ignavibacteria bacterium RBG_13_36_8]